MTHRDKLISGQIMTIMDFSFNNASAIFFGCEMSFTRKVDSYNTHVHVSWLKKSSETYGIHTCTLYLDMIYIFKGKIKHWYLVVCTFISVASLGLYSPEIRDTHVHVHYMYM